MQKFIFEKEYQREAPISIFYIWSEGHREVYKLLNFDINLADRVFADFKDGFIAVYTQRDNIEHIKRGINNLDATLLNGLLDQYRTNFSLLKNDPKLLLKIDFVKDLISGFIISFITGDIKEHELQEKALELRVVTEHLFDLIYHSLCGFCQDKDNFKYYTYEEIINNQILSSEILQRRAHCIAAANNQIHPVSLREYVTQFGIQIKGELVNKKEWVNLYEVPFRHAFYLESGLRIFSDESLVKDLPQYNYRNGLFYCHNGGVQAYHLKNEIEQSGDWGLKAHLKAGAVDEHITRGLTLIDDIYTFHRLMDGKNLTALLKEELKPVFLSLSDFFEKTSSYYKLCNDEFQEKIKDYIQNYLATKNIIDTDFIFKLITPTSQTSTDKMEIDTLRASLLFLEKGEESEEFKKSVAILVENYGAIGCGEGGKLWGAEHFISHIKDIAKSGEAEVKKTLLSKDTYHEKIIRDREDSINQYDISEEIQKVTSQIGELAHLKYEIRVCWAFLDYMTVSIFHAISEITHIPINELVHYETDEIIGLLSKDNYQRPDVKERDTALYVLEDGIFSLFYGEKAKTLFNEKIKNEQFKEVSELRGQIVSKGNVRGIVKIISPLKDQSTEMEKVLEGDILVTGMTRPHMLPAMKRAIAFVTDEGGITCHAAIVAREMRKPCVVATRIATKVLKDGDMIEVDADNGIIRVLNQ